MNRADIEAIALKLFEQSIYRDPLHWYGIGRQRRDLWRLLAMSVLEEREPHASDSNVKQAWEMLRNDIPNDLG